MTQRVGERLIEQRKQRHKHWLLVLGILATVLLVIGAAYLAADFLGYFKSFKPATAVPGAQDKRALSKKINILVLGIDKRRHDGGRSNVTSVLTVDTAAKSVSALWIPRDSRVRIPGHGWDKIGHAYAFDGPFLSKRTVEALLGIPIDYYLAVDMGGFCKIVDAVGGVDIDVEKRLYYYDPYDENEAATNYGLIDLKPGIQHMDGNTALQYVRFRNDEMGDIGRIERQRKFLRAFLTRLTSPAVIAKIPSVIREANNAVKTDLPLGEMFTLGNIAKDTSAINLKTDMIPGEAVFIDNISYWVPDIAATWRQTALIQGITADEKYTAAARRLSEEYLNSLPDLMETDYGIMSPRELFRLRENNPAAGQNTRQ